MWNGPKKAHLTLRVFLAMLFRRGNVGKRHEEGGDLNRLWEDPSPDDAEQTTVRRSRRAGRDEGGSRTLRRSAGGCTNEEIRSSRDLRDHVEDG